MIKLLLVEDDANMSYILKSGLQDIIGGYDVITAANGAEGLKAWAEHHPDVILSDIEMPVMDGYEMVKQIRETDKDTIILFTTGMISPKNVTNGYLAGGDNYIKKPFVAEEVDAHIHGALNRKNGIRPHNNSEVYKLGRFTLNAHHTTLKNETTGVIRTLTVREAQVLQALCENKNEVVERSAILNRYWQTGDDYFTSRSLDVFINKLRNYLKEEESLEIKTVRSVGLMLLTDKK